MFIIMKMAVKGRVIYLSCGGGGGPVSRAANIF
jgi:hypothetical protein